jgi:hypothetical protein
MVVKSFMIQPQGACPRGESLKLAPLGQAPALLVNISFEWDGLPGINVLC